MAGFLLLIQASAVALFLQQALPAAVASGLSSFWQQELPHTTIPEAFEKLASPLPNERVPQYASQLKAGTLQASKNEGFCSSAGIYCQKAAIIVGVQPRVCIPPFFFYEYNVLRCSRDTGTETGTPSAFDASNTIFFSESSLSEGEAVQLPNTTNDLRGLKFLPRSIAEAFPEVTTKSLPELVKLYGVTEGSNMELDMQDTAAHCSFQSKHEIKACFISGEEMVSFVSDTVGQNVVAFSPPAITMQQATVVNVRVVSSKGGRVASCHDMKFPSLLYSCHASQSSQVLNVAMKLADGKTVQMPAICHMDTSYWNPSHIAFQVLNAKPGASSICHWLPQNSFIFVEGTDN